MAAGTVNLDPVRITSLSEKLVQYIEEMPPANPLMAAFLWGIALLLLSFAFHLATFQVNSKWLGWAYEFNWSSTFAFFIPLSLFLVVRCLPRYLRSSPLLQTVK